MAASQIRRNMQQSAIDCDIAEEEEYYVTRPHTSVRRYRQPAQRDTLDDEQAMQIQPRRASTIVPTHNRVISKAIDPSLSLKRYNQKRVPWLAIAIGMLVMMTLVMGIRAFGSWWQDHQLDATYGFPRTYQVNAVVGHMDGANKESHFIFMNMNGHVVVMEFPGGDTAHAMVYAGPVLYGDGNNLIPVTGEFKDVNGDGRPDMLVHIQEQTIVYINDGTKFRPLQPGEHVTLPS